MTSKQDGAVLHLHQDGPVGPEVGGAEGAHPGNDGELSLKSISVLSRKKWLLVREQTLG